MRRLVPLVCLVVVCTASAGVNAPQSGWYSGNPLLGPNALRDLACSGSTCYAVGDFGTLLKSADRGDHWEGIVTGVTLDFRRVGFAGGSSERVVVGADCALRRSDDGGKTFVRLPFTGQDDACSPRLLAFSFPTAETGYLLLGGGRVLATADGGQTFSERATVPAALANEILAGDLLCTAVSRCFATGSGIIFRTADGAVSWAQAVQTEDVFNRLSQADASTLYAGGRFGNAAKSTDGGQTWRRLSRLTGSDDIIDMDCGDAAHCLMATHNGSLDGPVYRTTNGGVWASQVVPSSDPTYAVAFAGATRSLAAGKAGNAQVSDDSGATWRPVGTRFAGTLGALTATSASVAYAGGRDGVLIRTGDAGRSWSRVTPPSVATLIGLAGVGTDRLYVLGEDGSLLRSDNGGASYRILGAGGFRPSALTAADENRLVLVGSAILISEDAGETFRRAPGVANARLTAADLARKAVFAYGARRLYRSIDGGRHWRRVNTPKRREIFDVDFLDRNNGYLLAIGGILWKTSDAGRHWRMLPALGRPPFAIDFPSRREGFVSVQGFGRHHNRGVLLHTTDGGRSWHPQLVSPFGITLLAGFGSVEYALAGGNALYATGVGGDVGAGSALAISARPRSLRHPGLVTVGGRLSPADGGEEVVVSRLVRGHWMSKSATAASNGTFQTRWHVNRNSVFVAQVLGDATTRGAGTQALAVRVGR